MAKFELKDTKNIKFNKYGVTINTASKEEILDAIKDLSEVSRPFPFYLGDLWNQALYVCGYNFEEGKKLATQTGYVYQTLKDCGRMASRYSEAKREYFFNIGSTGTTNVKEKKRITYKAMRIVAPLSDERAEYALRRYVEGGIKSLEDLQEWVIREQNGGNLPSKFKYDDVIQLMRKGINKLFKINKPSYEVREKIRDKGKLLIDKTVDEWT